MPHVPFLLPALIGSVREHITQCDSSANKVPWKRSRNNEVGVFMIPHGNVGIRFGLAEPWRCCGELFDTGRVANPRCTYDVTHATVQCSLIFQRKASIVLLGSSVNRII